MRCEEVREHCAEYLVHALDAGAARAFEAHLASCAECQAEFADLGALWQALGEMPAPAVPSNRMRERFASMLAGERAQADRRPASRRTARGAWAMPAWHGTLAQFAFAASLLVAGVVVGRITAPAAPPPQAAPAAIAEVRSELSEMRQMLTLSLLQQQSATERLRGVSSTAQIDRPGNEVVAALLDTLLHDPNVNVRLAAVDALRRFSDRPDVRLGTKQAVADTSSPLLQVAVIDFMVETRDPQAAPLLRSLAADPRIDPSVRGRASWGLEHLVS